MTTRQITMVIPYYRNPKMLRAQIDTWIKYTDKVRRSLQITVVDDGSPERAYEVFTTQDINEFVEYGMRVDLYRIVDNIPWNRGGARNLGSMMAETPWLLHMDIDHVLPVKAAEALIEDFKPIAEIGQNYTHRFRRFRNGQADATRKKDALPECAEYGEIKPHIDSYLCTKEAYLKVGGYDEDYSGCLGGGSPFLKQLGAIAPFVVAPSSIWLEVYTQSTISDSSDMSLSRDTSEYIRRKEKKEKLGKTKAVKPLRFKWEQVF